MRKLFYGLCCVLVAVCCALRCVLWFVLCGMCLDCGVLVLFRYVFLFDVCGSLVVFGVCCRLCVDCLFCLLMFAVC